MGDEKKGKTNMVKLRNNAPEGGRLVMRSAHSQRDDGAHIARPKKSTPGKTAWYPGDNYAVRLYALGNPTADPPVQPYLVPVDDAGRAWLKDVKAEQARMQAELEEQ
jgi:hypothetical protein